MTTYAWSTISTSQGLSFTAGDTDGAVAAVTQRNFQRWRTVQDEIFRTLIGSAARTRGPEEDAALAAAAK